MMANNLKVGILGYTGETGKALTQEILKNNIFKNVTLIGRRVVDYNDDLYKNTTQKVVDFEKLDADAFKDLDVLYCCLGTTRRNAGSAEAFRRVDFDYVLESAKLAKHNGCKQFHLVSSSNANKNGYFLYTKVKGQIEEAVSDLGFEKCAIYRPAFLLCDRVEYRFGERLALFLTKPIQILMPTLMSTPVETLSKAMIKNTLNESKKVEIIDNAHIFKLAAGNP